VETGEAGERRSLYFFLCFVGANRTDTLDDPIAGSQREAGVGGERTAAVVNVLLVLAPHGTSRKEGFPLRG
jgi:hypothetical protein